MIYLFGEIISDLGSRKLLGMEGLEIRIGDVLGK